MLPEQKLGAKQTPMYMDRGGDLRPLVAIHRHATNPDELVVAEYTQKNGMNRRETVDRGSIERLVVGVDKV